MNEYQEKLAKRCFWLAWKASSVVGMGCLQDCSNATEEEVWENVVKSGDYRMNFSTTKRLIADYVFCRMMKLKIEPFGENDLKLSPAIPSSSCQSWASTYSTSEDLQLEAMISLEQENEN